MTVGPLVSGVALIVVLCIVGFSGCRKQQPNNESSRVAEMSTTVTKEKALEIAHADAITAYMDLSNYNIDATLENGSWIIQYTPAKGRGGGPYYKISATSGEIIEKRYYQ
jgi:hypothetical protein